MRRRRPQPGPVPLIDEGRRAIVLPRSLLPVVLARTGAETTPGHPLVGHIAAIITNPGLIVAVDITTRAGSETRTLWATADGAVVGQRVSERSFELIEVDPDLIAFSLVQAAGVTPLGPPTEPTRLRIPASSFDAAPFCTTPGGRLDAIDSVCNIQAVWVEAGSKHVAALEFAAGPPGYWRITRRDGLVNLRPTSFFPLTTRIAALLPRLTPFRWR